MDVDLDRASVAGRDLYPDSPTSGPVAGLPRVDRRQHIGRLLHAVDRRVLEPKAMTIRGHGLAASFRRALPLTHLEEIAEIRIDGDVALEKNGAGAGVVYRPLIRDRRVDADTAFDVQPTERIPQERPVGKDLRGQQAQPAVPGPHLVRRNVTRVPGVYPSATP